MPTLPTTSLTNPVGTDAVPHSTLVYFRSRLKQRMFGLIIREFKNSGLSKADLARRLSKEPAQVSRLLAGPGNTTLDTVSDILFAATGGEAAAKIEYPLARNIKLLNVVDQVVARTNPARVVANIPNIKPELSFSAYETVT